MRAVPVLSFVLVASLACGSGDPPVPTEPAAAPVPAGPTVALPDLGLPGERPDDCTMEDASTFDPLLVAVPPGASTPEVARPKGAIVESTTLADGTRVRVVRSGCAHFAETWHVAPAPTGELVPAATALVGSFGLPEAPAVARCLERAPNPLPEDGHFTDQGDFWCTVTRTEGVLTLIYDFAL